MMWLGKSLHQHDPKRNLLVSVHAYCATLQYDGFAEINAAVRNNVPLVFGEIANKQFANGDQCYYGIDGTNVKNPPSYVTPSDHYSSTKPCSRDLYRMTSAGWPGPGGRTLAKAGQ